MIWLESLLFYLLALMIQTESRPHHPFSPQLLSGLLWSIAGAWQQVSQHGLDRIPGGMPPWV